MSAPLGTRLTTGAPFHLEATVRVLQRRPANRVDIWQDDRYRRLFVIGDEPVLVEVANHGSIDRPELRYTTLCGTAAPELGDALERLLGLAVDPALLQRVADAEPALRDTVRALRGMRAPRFTGLLETFASVIPFQQLSLDAGVAILGRIVERFGRCLDHDGQRYYAFPTACVLADAPMDELRGCGLSTAKADTLRGLARAIDAGELTEAAIAALSTREAQQALTALPGIGPWSAGLVLLRGFGRLDVFPPGDAGAARSVGALLRLGAPTALDASRALDGAVERFGTERGYLYFCGIGASLLARGLIRAA